MDRDQLPQAWLFVGPPSVGKFAAAYAFACSAMSEGHGDAAVGLQDRLRAQNHPDLRVFSPRSEGAGNLPVQRIREDVLPFARFAPFEAKRAFLLFRDVDVALPATQPEAANALLKALEEPRPHVHYVLSATNLEAVLPTIRSRCQTLRFQALADQVLAKIGTGLGISEEAIATALPFADGRIDRLTELCADGEAEGLLRSTEAALDIFHPARGPRSLGPWLSWTKEHLKHPQLSSMLVFLAHAYRDVAAIASGTATKPRAPGLERKLNTMAAQLDGARAASMSLDLLHVAEDVAHPAISTQLALEGLWHRLAS